MISSTMRRERIEVEASQSIMRVQLSCNYDALDLRRAFIDLRNLCIAEVSLDRIILHVAVTAEDLHRLIRAEHRSLACEQLGHRASLLHVLSSILRLRGEM